MTIVKLPNGRYRARIWHDKRDVPVGQILGTGPISYRTKAEAKDAYAEARRPGEGGDVGARLVALTRRLVQIESENAALKRVWEADSEALQRAEAAARDFASFVRRLAIDHPYGFSGERAAKEVLACHPSFSGEEGTEG